MRTFYLGTHRPGWLGQLGVPLFISASTMSAWKSTGDDWPTRRDTFRFGGWALDSGAFTALAPSTVHRDRHPWHLDPDSFGGMVTRFAEEVGIAPDFAAIQDVPCEPELLAANGMTVAGNQADTLDSYLYLAAEFDFINWSPVLQGWKPVDYVNHMRAYERAGVELWRHTPVGLGSVCRRGRTRDIVAVVQTVQAYARATYGRELRLHGFGLKSEAVGVVGHLLDSADSQAWSRRARLENIHLDGCVHPGPCNNCRRYALAWRDQVLAAAGRDQQMALDLQLAEVA